MKKWKEEINLHFTRVVYTLCFIVITYDHTTIKGQIFKKGDTTEAQSYEFTTNQRFEFSLLI